MQTALISTFPERLRSIMDETGIRQTDLCDKAGIGKSAMSQYLHGAFIPKQTKLSAIAEALGVSEGWLMGYDVPRVRSTYIDADGSIGAEHAEEYIEIFVRDDHMAGAYIPKGARVILKKLGTDSDEDMTFNGEIVGICVAGGRPMLKFLYSDGDKMLATTSDHRCAPMVFDAKDLKDGRLQILGVVERVEIRF